MCFVSTYRCMKKEFAFLTKEYDFKITMKCKGGFTTDIKYTNPNICIKISEYQRKVNPLIIFVYPPDSWGDDAIQYSEEFDQSSKKKRVRIRAAAEWLRKAIEDHTIPI